MNLRALNSREWEGLEAIRRRLELAAAPPPLPSLDYWSQDPAIRPMLPPELPRTPQDPNRD